MSQVSEKEGARRAEQSAHDRIVREAETLQRTGLSRTTRWRLAKAGKFPKPVSITDSAIGWRESEIEAWIAARQAA